MIRVALRNPYLIVALAIPLSILAAFIGLFYTGDTINAMTLGGLALAVGILVDQSIVVLENIVRHVRMGKDPRTAAFDGASEVAMPILVSTITFVVVFYPIVFMSGMARYLFTPLALAATFAIIASYLISITLIPAYCARFFGQTTDLKRAESQGGGGLAARYQGLVERAISHRWLVLAGAGLLLGVGLLALFATGRELFPQVDAGQFQMLVRLPSGTHIERTEQVVAEIEGVIIERLGEPDPEYPRVERYPDSELKILISNIGVLMDWLAAYTPQYRAHGRFPAGPAQGSPRRAGYV